MRLSWRAGLRYRERSRLRSIDPASTPLFDGSKDEAEDQTKSLLSELDELQVRLYASATHGVLVVLQGRDASGKDGIVRKVLGEIDPLGFSVHAFKAPTEIEAAHDFLWRVHAKVPGRGELVVFNRSHYEDVLIRRVRRLDPERVWRARYTQIRAFEESLARDGGTAIVKIHPLISKKEQAERFRERLQDPKKRWKFRSDDLADRARWAAYDAAYEAAFAETDADHAPWYIVPADRKWYRDLAVARLIYETLTGLRLRYPEPDEDLSKVKIV